MALGVKFLILGASLVGASCGGYVIYKNVSISETEKTNGTVIESSGDQSSVKKPAEKTTEPESTELTK